MFPNTIQHMGHGISPQKFIDGMTKNQDTFQDWYRQFSWKNDSVLTAMRLIGQEKKVRCLIIAADWCGDVVRNVPVIFRAMEEANIPTELFIMEEHLSFIDDFLTMGGRSIPVVLFVNDSGDVVAKWGPRPKAVQQVMIDFKTQNTDRSAPDYEGNLAAARAEMRRRYGEGTDYQQVIINELVSLLSDID